MGRPQLGLPRLRVRATGIAIGPDHTPHRVAPHAESLRGWRVVCGGEGVLLSSAVWRFQWRCITRGTLHRNEKLRW